MPRFVCFVDASADASSPTGGAYVRYGQTELDDEAVARDLAVCDGCSDGAQLELLLYPRDKDDDTEIARLDGAVFACPEGGHLKLTLVATTCQETYVHAKKEKTCGKTTEKVSEQQPPLSRWVKAGGQGCPRCFTKAPDDVVNRIAALKRQVRVIEKKVKAKKSSHHKDKKSKATKKGQLGDMHGLADHKNKLQWAANQEAFDEVVDELEDMPVLTTIGGVPYVYKDWKDEEREATGLWENGSS